MAQKNLLSSAVTLATMNPDFSVKAFEEDIRSRMEPKAEEAKEELSDTYQGFEFDLKAIFTISAHRLVMRKQGRLQGKHCQPRLRRAIAKSKRK